MSATARLEVGVVVCDDERLLLVRHGHGPAGGVWDLPGRPVVPGATVAETAVLALAEQAAIEGVAGALVGLQERPEADPPTVRLVVEGLLPGDAVPAAGAGVAEARWHALDDLAVVRFVDGLALFLHEHEVIELVL